MVTNWCINIFEKECCFELFCLGFVLGSGPQFRVVNNWFMNIFGKECSFELIYSSPQLRVVANWCMNIFVKECCFELFCLGFTLWSLFQLRGGGGSIYV